MAYNSGVLSREEIEHLAKQCVLFLIKLGINPNADNVTEEESTTAPSTEQLPDSTVPVTDESTNDAQKASGKIVLPVIAAVAIVAVAIVIIFMIKKKK